MKRILLRIIYSAIILVACKEKRIYDNDLSNPKSVLNGYIQALIHGDTNQALYYVSGDLEKVKDFGLLGRWAEGKSRERAKRRFTEHIKWNIREEKCGDGSCIFNVIIHVPDGGYYFKRMDELTGDGLVNGVFKTEVKMSYEKARSIIRKEKNLPLESKEFEIYMKKNEYGWVFDSLNDENEKLNDFIDRS